MTSWLNEFDARIAQLDAAHLRRVRRTTEPLHGAHMRVDGQELLAFCSNDYLGLAQHPALVEAACAGAKAYGVGSGGSALVSGHSKANDALETSLAHFLGLPRALYFYAGFSTNAGIVPALVGAGDAIFSDALNHACLIDGARLSRADIHRFAHADLADLQRQLAASAAPRKLIMSDAVFSMDGDVANVPALLALAEKYDALLLVDDAHGFGVLGPQGRGTLAHYGLSGAAAPRRLLYMATLSKAAGASGGLVAGDATLIEWLVQKTRSYIFATAAPPLLACALQAALQVIEHDQARRQHLYALIAHLKAGLAPIAQQRGWKLLPSATPIQALVIGDNAAALALMQALRARGLWVPAIRPPTVPEGTARLRIALSAAHTRADVDALLHALAHSPTAAAAC